jgi:hypothetical protein
MSRIERDWMRPDQVFVWLEWKDRLRPRVRFRVLAMKHYYFIRHKVALLCFEVSFIMESTPILS